jgi:UPF0755 protein
MIEDVKAGGTKMKQLLRISALTLAVLFLSACGMFAPIPGSGDVTQPYVYHTTGRESVLVTIPEGFNFFQIARRLEERGVVSAAEFFRAAQSFQVQSFDTPFSPQAAFNLEGFLFPDTYEFFIDHDANDVLRIILNNYAARALPMMQDTPRNQRHNNLSDYDILILASIIEREARSDEHMVMVSSVFHNRIAIDMMMQSCPTRDYARDVIMPSTWFGGDIAQWRPLYDTYQRRFPIGPICNPGARAIYAALNPTESNYLFFFFGMDNNNHYSRTYAEHNAAMARVGVNFG